MLPPELQPRPGDELEPGTPRHGTAVRVIALVVVLAMVLTTVGAIVFTFFLPLPL